LPDSSALGDELADAIARDDVRRLAEIVDSNLWVLVQAHWPALVRALEHLPEAFFQTRPAVDLVRVFGASVFLESGQVNARAVAMASADDSAALPDRVLDAILLHEMLANRGGNAIDLLNTYEAVSIEIEKRILGSDQGRAAGPYPVTVVCTIVEDNLPAQASCVVTETDAGTANATTIAFAGGPAVPSTRGTFVLPLGLTAAATITVTNQFDLAFTGGGSGTGGMLIGLALLLWGAAAVIGIAFWRRRRRLATA